jgi:hypothetical protein
MPASTYSLGEPAPDPDILISRYMDFTKYVSMLAKRALYFCRSDKLGDSFEGSVPMRNWEAEQKENLRASGIRKHFRNVVHVNCWHMNPVESMAMWNCYARPGIAIQSSCSRLRNSFPDTYAIGTVKYIDYRTDEIPRKDLFSPYFHKRRSYEHERELRVLRSAVQPPPEEPKDGIWAEVDLLQLISAVYVSPGSPTWFRELVIEVSNRYELSRPVLPSGLDTPSSFEVLVSPPSPP